MKKMFFALMMLATTISAKAMSYEQARNEALFLTDKMAYELNLTEEQYEAAYEINLDYLMGVTGRADVFGTYWERRNLDLSYILFDWQWNAFVAATYFYRPLYWEAGYWHFGIYLRYPHRDYFYFGYPHFYVTYRGGHAWHRHGGHGYYHGHSNHYRGHHDHHVGMHDRWDRGDFRGSRHSSTRVTGGRHHDQRNHHDGGVDNRRHDQRNHRDGGSGNFSGRRDGQQNHIGNQSPRNYQPRITERSHSSGSRGGFSGRSHSTESRSSGSHSGGSHSSGSFSSGPRSGGSHSSSTRGGFSGSSHGGGSHGGGSHGGGSHGGGSHGHGGHR